MLSAFRRSSPRETHDDIEVVAREITGGRLNTIYEDLYHAAVKNSPQRELLLKAFAEDEHEEVSTEPVYALTERNIGLSNPSQLMKSLRAWTLGGHSHEGPANDTIIHRIHVSKSMRELKLEASVAIKTVAFQRGATRRNSGESWEMGAHGYHPSADAVRFPRACNQAGPRRRGRRAVILPPGVAARQLAPRPYSPSLGGGRGPAGRGAAKNACEGCRRRKQLCCPPRFRTAQAANFSRYSFGVR